MDYQLILALLTKKFSGVRKDGLEQMARSMALHCSSEEDAKAIVDKLTDAQVGDYIKEFRKVVDAEVSSGNKTFEANLKKKYELVEKKSDNEPNGGGGDSDPNKDEPKDIAAIVAKAVSDAVKPFKEQLSKYEADGISKARLQALHDKLAGCKDEAFVSQTLADYARMQFASDEDFNEYLSSKEQGVKTANQSFANARLGGGGGAPQFGKKTDDGVSQAVADYITSKKPEANALAGKEV